MSIAGVNETLQTARKDYECWGCSGPILKGTLYARQGLMWGAPAHPYHTACVLSSTSECECVVCCGKRVEVQPHGTSAGGNTMNKQQLKDKAKADWAKAVADGDRAKADLDKAVADGDRAIADGDKALADWARAKADWARAERVKDWGGP